MLAYAARYAAVAKRAKLAFKPPATTRGLDVVEHIKGDGGTEFGVPGKPAAAEDGPSRRRPATAARPLQASWTVFDRAAKKAVGVELTKGPRGGGRELPKIVEHVREAEVAYLGQLGSRAPAAADETDAKPMAALRRTFAEALTAVATGEPLENPRNTRKPWTPRYAVRRSAWHVLDHAWEIEDRASCLLRRRAAATHADALALPERGSGSPRGRRPS